MKDKRATRRLTRRRFLSGLAVLGTAPIWPRSQAWTREQIGVFTGDDLDLAHRLLTQPAAILAQDAPRVQPDLYADAILADFVTGRHATHAVLTVYRPYPYAGGRAALSGATYGEMEREVRREVLAGFGPHGLRPSDIEGVELCRWGHPMLVARPGQMADGTIDRAARSQPGLYFAHTEVNGAPAYENAVAAAHDAVDAVRQFLGRTVA